MLSLSVAAAVALVVLATSFMSGIFGMAGGMVLMGVLVMILPVPAAMVLHGLTQTASNGWRAWMWRRYADPRIFGLYLAGTLLAVGAFAVFAFVPEKSVIFIVLGLLPFLAAAVPDRLVPRADRPIGAVAAGITATGFQLVSGVSGPALDIFFVRTGLDRRAVVATKAMCQVSSHLAKMSYFAGLVLSGEVADLYALAAVSIVLALVGTSLSRVVLERLTDVQFRVWTQRLVMLVGVVYLAQGLRELAGS